MNENKKNEKVIKEVPILDHLEKGSVRFDEPPKSQLDKLDALLKPQSGNDKGNNK